MGAQHSFVDIFAGCGGMSRGFEDAGFRCAGFVEFWDVAVETYERNVGGQLMGRDVKDVKDEQLAGMRDYDIDVLIGGPPCQGFSLANPKHDLRDPRNSLFREFVRFCREVRPKFFVMENVPAILYRRTMKGELVRNIIFSEFTAIGYRTSIFILDASKFGVPQSRRRAFFIGNRVGKRNYLPEMSGKTISMRDAIGDLSNMDPSPDLQHVWKRMSRSDLIHWQANRKRFGQAGKRPDWRFPSPTVTASAQLMHPVFPRYLSVRECARLQTFSDGFRFSGNRDAMYRQIGNAVPVRLAEAIARKMKEAM